MITRDRLLTLLETLNARISTHKSMTITDREYSELLSVISGLRLGHVLKGEGCND